MQRASKYWIYGLIGLLAAASGIYFGLQSHEPRPALPRQVAALFAQTLTDSEGKPHTLAAWRGKVLVVNFWAPWCPPCVEEMPELAAWQRQMQDKNVQVIGIGVDSAANIREFLSKNQSIDYPLLVAGIAGIELSRQLGNAQGGLPYTVMLDAQGRILYQKSGRITLPELMNHL